MVEERDDATLLQAWRNGDETSGSLLVRRHFDAVVRFLERRLEPDSVDEVLGATFEACIAGRERMPDDVAFRGYLLGIAWNKVKMHLRQLEARKGIEPLAEEPRDGASLRASSFVAAREEESLLIEALLRLDSELQLVLELFYWEELDTASIAAVLGVPRGTVKSRLSRARLHLKDQVDRLARSPMLAARAVDDIDHWVAAMRGRWR